MLSGGDCMLCQSVAEGPLALCQDCLRELPVNDNACPQCACGLSQPGNAPCGSCQTHPPHYDRAIVPYHYAAPFDGFITRLKFNNQLANARLMGQLLLRTLQARMLTPPLPQIILPMPLHATRLRQRGFNQALELARPLARAFALPLETRRVQRQRNTPPQSDLKQQARKQNIRNAFKVNGKLPYRHVAILDDVITTGSTVNELAKILKQCGVEYVEVWAVARA